MADYLFSYGDYTFPTGFYVASGDFSTDVPLTKIPRGDGAQVQPGYLEPVRLMVKGGLSAGVLPNIEVTSDGPVSDVRTAWDTLLAAMRSGRTSGLILTTEDDRHWVNARCSKCQPARTDPPSTDMLMVDLEFDLPDPYQYAASDLTDTWSSPSGTRTIVGSEGDASAAPVYTITLAAIGAVDLMLTNTTTGVYFTLAGAPAQTVILVDTLNEAVTYGDGTDAMWLFEGQFPLLLPGNNVISISETGETVSSVVTTWTPRWG